MLPWSMKRERSVSWPQYLKRNGFEVPSMDARYMDAQELLA